MVHMSKIRRTRNPMWIFILYPELKKDCPSPEHLLLMELALISGRFRGNGPKISPAGKADLPHLWWMPRWFGMVQGQTSKDIWSCVIGPGAQQTTWQVR